MASHELTTLKRTKAFLSFTGIASTLIQWKKNKKTKNSKGLRRYTKCSKPFEREQKQKSNTVQWTPLKNDQNVLNHFKGQILSC